MNLGRSAFGQNAPLIQHGDRLGQIHDDAHVVFDQKNCRGGVEGADQCFEGVDFGFGQALGRFIENEQAGVLCEAHADFEDALVAIAEVAGGLIGAVCQAYLFNDCGQRFSRGIAGSQLAAGGQRHVVGHRQPRRRPR